MKSQPGFRVAFETMKQVDYCEMILDLLGQTRVWIGVAVDAADGHVVRGAVARQPGVLVLGGHNVRRDLFAVFLCARDLTGETVARVAFHRERGSVIYGTREQRSMINFKSPEREDSGKVFNAY